MVLHKESREHEDGKKYVRQSPHLGEGKSLKEAILRLQFGVIRRVARGTDNTMEQEGKIGDKSNNCRQKGCNCANSSAGQALVILVWHQ
jgi:hypothetical protein